MMPKMIAAAAKYAAGKTHLLDVNFFHDDVCAALRPAWAPSTFWFIGAAALLESFFSS